MYEISVFILIEEGTVDLESTGIEGSSETYAVYFRLGLFRVEISAGLAHG